MNKVSGIKSDFAAVRDEGSRIVIGYGLTKIDKSHYEWYETYLYKKQISQLTLQVIKDAVLADINAQVKAKITSGFRWNDMPVWLSEENQINFSTAVVPATLKIGEQEDGTAVYHQFDTQEEMDAFNNACVAYKQQCLQEGWQQKDAMDWSPFEALFPQQDAQQNVSE